MATWIDKARAMLRTAEILAKFTRTTTDDEIIAAIKTAIENPQIQAVIDWVINSIHANPELSIPHAADKCPEHLMAAAVESYGKIGDGKIINLLIKILPILLAL